MGPKIDKVSELKVPKYYAEKMYVASLTLQLLYYQRKMTSTNRTGGWVVISGKGKVHSTLNLILSSA